MSSPTTLTRPHPTVWQISLTSRPDNRLTPPLLASLQANLDIVEEEWRRSGGGSSRDPKGRGKHGGAGALVLTSECPRFFSNGLDFENAVKNPHFWESESRFRRSIQLRQASQDLSVEARMTDLVFQPV